MPTVHPTAIVGPEVVLADDVIVGPYCVLESAVRLGAGVRLGSHACLKGPLTVGAGTAVYPHASLGFEAQDYKFRPGTPTAGVVIGENCLIREHATVHAATNTDRPTRVGDRVFLMVNAHVGHDAVVHHDVILVNNAALGGHTEVFDRAILSGGVIMHQHGRVGRLAMCSGGAVVTNDVPPFCMSAQRNMLVGLNLVGMRRSGMAGEEIDAVKRAYGEVLRRNPPRSELLGELAERGRSSPSVLLMHDFVAGARRAIAPVGGRRINRSSNAPGEGLE